MVAVAVVVKSKEQQLFGWLSFYEGEFVYPPSLLKLCTEDLPLHSVKELWLLLLVRVAGRERGHQTKLITECLAALLSYHSTHCCVTGDGMEGTNCGDIPPYPQLCRSAMSRQCCREVSQVRGHLGRNYCPMP